MLPLACRRCWRTFSEALKFCVLLVSPFPWGAECQTERYRWESDPMTWFRGEHWWFYRVAVTVQQGVGGEKSQGGSSRLAWGEAAPAPRSPSPGPRHPASPWGWKWACGQGGHSCGELEAGPAVTFLGQRFTVQGPGAWSWWGRALEELKWGPGPWSELGEPQGS